MTKIRPAKLVALIALLNWLSWSGFGGSAFAEDPATRGPNGLSVGNQSKGRGLSPSRQIECIGLGEATSDLTPPDLHSGLRHCIADGSYEKAVELFLLAGAYTTYDVSRVKDSSVADASTVMSMQTAETLTAEQRALFGKAINSLGTDAGRKDSICKGIQKLGPPSYRPDYLIFHGIDYVMDPASAATAMRQDFTSDEAWQRVQKNYLHCG